MKSERTQRNVFAGDALLALMPDPLIGGEMVNPGDDSVDTIIVSDIHLGSDVSRSADLLLLLKGMKFRRLILNGDVFDDLNFNRLDKEDWQFLSYLRKLANPRRNCEVVWVAGNHDGMAEMLSHLLGVPVYEEYTWQMQGTRYLAIHGHQFDTFLNDNVFLSDISSRVYLWIQKLDRERQRPSRWIKRTSKAWLRLSDKIACDAVEYGRLRGADVVFCGHTHLAVSMLQNGISYMNSGCWTDVPAHYIVVGHDKRTEIRDS